MTAALPELGGLPAGFVLDGELVAWRGSQPYFPHICRRVLNRDLSVPMTFNECLQAQHRSWVKVKNPHYWPRDAEREAMARKHKRRLPAHI
jgi:hypothetical protein